MPWFSGLISLITHYLPKPKAIAGVIARITGSLSRSPMKYSRTISREI